MKKVIAFILTTSMLFMFSLVSFADTNTKFRVQSNNFYLNMLAASPSAVGNGTQLTTWNTIDTSGCQDFTVKDVTTSTAAYEVMYLKGSSTYVVSYNRYTAKPEMYKKDVNNPYTEYGMQVWPLLYANSTIDFYFVTGQPYLIANGAQVTYGSEYGFKLNTATSNSSNTGSNTAWRMA